MSAIKTITIHDFQSHEETRMELHPGVNILSGQSDSGKTAVLRALDWALNNRPQGDEYRREGSKTTTVEVEFVDGTTVQRQKDRTVSNSYYLKTPDPDKVTGMGVVAQEYKAFGVSVPPDVLRAVSMSPINWQRQLDAPFLLSETAGEVARKLNKIVRLDVIDMALSRIATLVRDNSADSRAVAGNVESLTASEEGFAYLDKMEAAVEAAEILHARKLALETDAQRLDSLMNTVRLTRGDLVAADKDLEGVDLFDEIERLTKERDCLKVREEDLTQIGREAKRHREAMRGVKDADECEEAVSEVESLIKQQEEHERAAHRLGNILSEIHKAESYFNELGREIEPLEEQLKGTCSECGRELQ
jgi:exonuclease SbcC